MSNESDVDDADEEQVDSPDTEPEQPADAEAETGAEAGEGAAAGEEDEGGEDGNESGLQEGDFVKLEYTARTVEEGLLVDTTDSEVAEEEGMDEQGREFKPRTLVLGAGHMFPTLEDHIVGSEVGDTGSVLIEAEEAFGEYEEDQVRTVSANKIDEDDRYPGAQVTVDGEQGVVETIIGGRARVDFNHPLAGDDIEYEYEVVGVVEDRLEKAEGMMDLFLDVDLDMWIQTDEVEEEQLVEPDEDEDEDKTESEDEEEPPEPEYETVTVEKETLYIEATPQLSMNQQWLFQKQQICQQLMERVDVDRVIVQEIIDGAGGMMGMGGMMGGGMGGAEMEEALEEADVDAEEVLEEIED